MAIQRLLDRKIETFMMVRHTRNFHIKDLLGVVILFFFLLCSPRLYGLLFMSDGGYVILAMQFKA